MDDEENIRVSGQRRYKCNIVGCPQKGRILAIMGSMQITYCPKHRTYGTRVLNFLVNSLYRYELTDFLQENKQNLFMRNLPQLPNESYETLGSYVMTMVDKLDKIKKLHDMSTDRDIVSEDDLGSPDDYDSINLALC